MTSLDRFTRWIRNYGGEVEITQEDDGSGYTCLLLLLPGEAPIEITVNE